MCEHLSVIILVALVRYPETSRSEQAVHQAIIYFQKAMDIRRRRQRVVRNRIPKVVIEDPELNKAITRLPANYNFEIHKTVWRIREVSGRYF